jgi:hypothetical protein
MTDTYDLCHRRRTVPVPKATADELSVAWSSALDRGVVLDASAYFVGAFDAGQASHEVERHVDTGADAGAGDDVAVVDEAGVDVCC